MNEVAEKAFSFFVANSPTWRSLALGGPPALAWAYACLHFAGHLKCQRHMKTGYTRKIFHFLIFTTAAALQVVSGTPALCLFGCMTSLVVFYAVARGPGCPLYEAMAREKDAPRTTCYIITPYFATLLGGLASSIIFGPAAVAGYLVTGLADAVAEPVGTRFGRHTYRAPSFGGVKCTRSLEGSAAVFAAATISLAIAALVCPAPHPPPCLWFALPLLGAACMLIEAISPHGWDNATLQIVPTWLAGVWGIVLTTE